VGEAARSRVTTQRSAVCYRVMHNKGAFYLQRLQYSALDAAVEKQERHGLHGLHGLHEGAGDWRPT
jgi:hypothetical protein